MRWKWSGEGQIGRHDGRSFDFAGIERHRGHCVAQAARAIDNVVAAPLVVRRLGQVQVGNQPRRVLEVLEPVRAEVLDDVFRGEERRRVDHSACTQDSHLFSERRASPLDVSNQYATVTSTAGKPTASACACACASSRGQLHTFDTRWTPVPIPVPVLLEVKGGLYGVDQRAEPKPPISTHALTVLTTVHPATTTAAAAIAIFAIAAAIAAAIAMAIADTTWAHTWAHTWTLATTVSTATAAAMAAYITAGHVFEQPANNVAIAFGPFEPG